MGGIFAQGKPRRRSIDYKQAKTRFMHRLVCAAAAAQPLNSIAEIGFAAGHTSLLMLEAAPSAHVATFDLGDAPWTTHQAQLLTAAYPGRFNFSFGPSQLTVPQHHTLEPTRRIELAFVDGAKAYTPRLLDILNLRPLATPTATLLFDEICTLGCANGTEPCADDCFNGAPKAYAHASHLGLIRVSECAWPPGFEQVDGICGGHFLAPPGDRAGGTAAPALSAEQESVRARLDATLRSGGMVGDRGKVLGGRRPVASSVGAPVSYTT